MKKDNYRKILSEKFKAANQLETGPLTEEDEEYLRILAEARANHAKIKAARQEARKRLAARAAAVLIVAALISSSYLLGMKSDTKASADNDDEVKVVQQGDNIIIGPGVSEEDGNVGAVTKTYYRLEDVPVDVQESNAYVINPNLLFYKATYKDSKNHIFVSIKYYDVDGNIIEIEEEYFGDGTKTILTEIRETFTHGEKEIYVQENTKGRNFMVHDGEYEVSVFIPEESTIKIEDILDGLVKTY